MKYALLMYADPDHSKGMSEAELDEVARRLGEQAPRQGPLIGGALEAMKS